MTGNMNPSTDPWADAEGWQPLTPFDAEPFRHALVALHEVVGDRVVQIEPLQQPMVEEQGKRGRTKQAQAEWFLQVVYDTAYSADGSGMFSFSISVPPGPPLDDRTIRWPAECRVVAADADGIQGFLAPLYSPAMAAQALLLLLDDLQGAFVDHLFKVRVEEL